MELELSLEGWFSSLDWRTGWAGSQFRSACSREGIVERGGGPGLVVVTTEVQELGVVLE